MPRTPTILRYTPKPGPYSNRLPLFPEFGQFLQGEKFNSDEAVKADVMKNYDFLVTGHTSLVITNDSVLSVGWRRELVEFHCIDRHDIARNASRHA